MLALIIGIVTLAAAYGAAMVYLYLRATEVPPPVVPQEPEPLAFLWRHELTIPPPPASRR
jgi:hypothetical protein